MKPEVAKNALIFFARVDLKGAEVPAAAEVISVLENYANAQAPAPAERVINSIQTTDEDAG